MPPSTLSVAHGRITEIWSDSAGGSFGSGYLLGGGLILTARHVVMPEGREPPTDIRARPLAIAHLVDGLQPADLVWPDLAQLADPQAPDAVLLKLREVPAGYEDGPRLGRPDDDGSGRGTEVGAAGFPAFAEKAEGRRDTEQISGVVFQATRLVARRYEIKDMTFRDQELNEELDWRGLSGAALISGGRVIGVLIARKKARERYDFSAIRIETLLAIPEFVAAIRGHMALDVNIENLIISTGAQPLPAGAEPIPPCPYPGLAYFGPNDADLFFGREAAIAHLTDAVNRQSFTVLAGASGSGKSSVVLAGLAPNLHRSGDWRISHFRVGAELKHDPFAALARALVPLYVESSSDTERLKNAKELATSLRAGELALPDVFAECRSRNKASRILLIADQFEEVFTLVTDDALRLQFIDALLAGFPDPKPGAIPEVCLILTLRGDFYGQALSHRPFADALQGHVENLGPMNRDELRQAIVRPAENAKISFDPGLVETLLDAVENKPGSLPLLQFALREMWGRQEKRTLTRRSYDAIGGVDGALAQRAEAIFDALTEKGANAQMEKAFQRLFTRLVTLGEGQEDTRRVVERRELGDEAWLLAQRLADERNRLVVVSRETAEVAHEALIRHWPKLAGWINRDRTFQSWLRQIKPNVKAWSDNSADEGTLLRGGPLAVAVEWLAQRRQDLSPEEREYIEASETAEIHAKERKQLALDAARERLARGEQKIKDRLRTGEYHEAKNELKQVIADLPDEADADLQAGRARCESRLSDISRLADFATAAKSVFQLSGEENFEKAQSASASALQAIGVFADPDWWERLPVAELERGQAEDLRQDIYRLLLLYSALQLVPGIRKLFPGREAGPPKSKSMLDLSKVLPLVPNFVIALIIRRGGLGPLRLPARLGDPQALAEFDKSFALLEQVWRVEEARAKEAGRQVQRSRSSELMEQIIQMLKELASGPKGTPIDYGRLLGGDVPAEFPEPVNAVDYFYVGLFNYFIAKRSGNAAIAKAIAVLQKTFPQLDARAPLPTAERLLRRAIALEPRNFWPHWVLGRTLQHDNNHRGAELAFNSAIALQPDYARGYEQRALSLACEWVKVRDNRLRDRANEDSDKALLLARGDPSVFWPRGELLQALGDMGGALNAYSWWLELEHDLTATIARGAGVGRLYELSMELLASSSSSFLHADAHALLALVYWTWKNYKIDALKAAETALSLKPSHPHALVVVGAVLLELGKPEEALERGLDPAIKANPQSYLALLERARAIESLCGDAMEAWQALLHHDQDGCPGWMIEEAEAAVTRLNRSPEPANLLK